MDNWFTKRILFYFWAFVLIIAFFFFKDLWLPFEKYPTLIRHLLSEMWFWWPLVYILAYTIRPLIFFPATVLTAVSWLIFWPIYWILYTVIWENLSANLSFLVWRYFWKDILNGISDRNKFMKLLDCKFRDNWFIVILTMRLIFMPFDLVWYLAWACNFKQRDFALGTFFWIIPWLTTFVLLWSSFTDPRNLIAAFVFFIIWLWISKYLKKKQVLEKSLKQACKAK